MATRKPVVPGFSDDLAAAPAPAELPRDVRAEQMGLPDFRGHSAEYAAAWFEANPSARKRNVLTAEGWYVHPEQPGDARMAGR
jgi:hypothetical protein